MEMSLDIGQGIFKRVRNNRFRERIFRYKSSLCFEQFSGYTLFATIKKASFLKAFVTAQTSRLLRSLNLNFLTEPADMQKFFSIQESVNIIRVKTPQDWFWVINMTEPSCHWILTPIY